MLQDPTMAAALQSSTRMTIDGKSGPSLRQDRQNSGMWKALILECFSNLHSADGCKYLPARLDERRTRLAPDEWSPVSLASFCFNAAVALVSSEPVRPNALLLITDTPEKCRMSRNPKRCARCPLANSWGAKVSPRARVAVPSTPAPHPSSCPFHRTSRPVHHPRCDDTQRCCGRLCDATVPKPAGYYFWPRSHKRVAIRSNLSPRTQRDGALAFRSAQNSPCDGQRRSA